MGKRFYGFIMLIVGIITFGPLAAGVFGWGLLAEEMDAFRPEARAAFWSRGIFQIGALLLSAALIVWGAIRWRQGVREGEPPHR